jgi:chromosome segregation ATPase
MASVKGSIIKKIILVIFIIVVAVVIAGINRNFSSKLSKISSQFENTKSDYAKLAKENQDLKAENSRLQGDFARIEKDFKASVADRENMLFQIKSLLPEKERIPELEASIENLKKQIETLQKEKQGITDNNLMFREKYKNLEAFKNQLLKEKAQLLETLERERAKSFIPKLEQDKLALQKENNDLNNKLKLSQADYVALKQNEAKSKDELSKASKELENAKDDLKKLGDEYSKALEKNKTFEQKVREMPIKFAEMARQNKALIRQTANLHYNMGVFYSKQKEFSRAVVEFEKAIELTPDDAYSHFNLGYIYAEYLVNRPKAIEQFRQYLRLARKDDKDVDWVKKYILTWESYQGEKPVD